MNASMKIRKIIKFIDLFSLFVLFWTASIIKLTIGGTNKEVVMGILYLILLLPVTIAILFNKAVFALLIIILYEAALLLIGVLVFSVYLAAGDLDFLTISSMLIEIIFSLLIISSAIQYLKNKTHTLKIATMIVGIIHLSLIVTSFIVNYDFGSQNWCDFLKNISLVMIFLIYIVTFPYVQLRIFKEEK